MIYFFSASHTTRSSDFSCRVLIGRISGLGQRELWRDVISRDDTEGRTYTRNIVQTKYLGVQPNPWRKWTRTENRRKGHWPEILLLLLPRRQAPLVWLKPPSRFLQVSGKILRGCEEKVGVLENTLSIILSGRRERVPDTHLCGCHGPWTSVQTDLVLRAWCSTPVLASTIGVASACVYNVDVYVLILNIERTFFFLSS